MTETDQVIELTKSVLAAISKDIDDKEIELRDLEQVATTKNKKDRVLLSKTIFGLRENLLSVETLLSKLTPPGADTIRSVTQLIDHLSIDESRAKLGRTNCLCQMAADKVRDQLSQPHEFADGTWSSPWLTPESVAKLKEGEDTHE